MTSNVIKLQAPFERLKKYTDNPEIALRKAIILQAIIDASNSSNQTYAKKIEQEAKNWIFGESDFFYKICYEAELEPQNVIKITREVIEMQKNSNRLIKKSALYLKLLNQHKNNT